MRNEPTPARDERPARRLLSPESLAPLREWIAAQLAGEVVDTTALSTLPEFPGVGGPSHPIYVCLRSRGKKVHDVWSKAEDVVGAIAEAIALAKEKAPSEVATVDAVQVEMCVEWERVDLRDEAARRRLRSNVHRGVRGVEFELGGRISRFTASNMIANNRDFPKVLDAFREEHRLTERDLEAKTKVRTFESRQFLWRKSADGPRMDEMFRGGTLVDVEEITESKVREMERVLGDFVAKSVQKDGRMIYMWFPSRATEDSKRNNQIRQWMATVSMCRTAKFRDDRKLAELAEHNIRYNLRKFYQASGNLGLIYEGKDKVKLGAVALATLALFEHPRREQFKRYEQRLWATIDHLWRDTGEFRTFFKPADRNDVQNFYPGEAQLAWAFRWEESRDEALLDRFMRSFRYYREWHLDPRNRNPAFVPWHTQAYYKVWKITRDDELRDFVFEMNDWLLSMQQWDLSQYPDTLGRFYDPQRPHYGPPHASSTGVYLEGLIDAFAMARELGMKDRAEAYRRTIVRGLRDAWQLTFKDDVDMFYVADREYLRGGLRTTVYDNVVRIDNVQHNQMAILKILSVFEPGDYRP